MRSKFLIAFVLALVIGASGVLANGSGRTTQNMNTSASASTGTGRNMTPRRHKRRRRHHKRRRRYHRKARMTTNGNSNR